MVDESANPSIVLGGINARIYQFWTKLNGTLHLPVLVALKPEEEEIISLASLTVQNLSLLSSRDVNEVSTVLHKKRSP